MELSVQVQVVLVGVGIPTVDPQLPRTVLTTTVANFVALHAWLDTLVMEPAMKGLIITLVEKEQRAELRDAPMAVCVYFFELDPKKTADFMCVDFEHYLDTQEGPLPIPIRCAAIYRHQGRHECACNTFTQAIWTETDEPRAQLEQALRERGLKDRALDDILSLAVQVVTYQRPEVIAFINALPAFRQVSVGARRFNLTLSL